MKKSLIALAVLAAAGAASAQSSVTLFGVVDATYQYTSATNGGSVTRLTNSGLNSSRLGVRGSEDLGGGLTASFWLEGSLNNDDGRTGGSIAAGNQGTSIAGNSGLNFNRRSTVSLSGGFGEVRLGRDYVPAFWNHTVFDPFGTNGSGSYSNVSLAYAGNTGVRASNSIGYFLPKNLGGFYGQFMYAMGENNSSAVNSSDGNHVGFRVGYAGGPLDVALGYGSTKAAAAGIGKYNNINLGGSYDLGTVKLMANWNRETYTSINGDHNTYLLGVSVPMGAGEIRASFAHAKADFDVSKANQFAVGYVHNLSKRTAVYATYANLKNSGVALNYGINGLISPSANGSSRGLDLGVRHSF